MLLTGDGHWGIKGSRVTDGQRDQQTDGWTVGHYQVHYRATLQCQYLVNKEYKMLLSKKNFFGGGEANG